MFQIPRECVPEECCAYGSRSYGLLRLVEIAVSESLMVSVIALAYQVQPDYGECPVVDVALADRGY
jgi:hypothetical protein